MKTYILFFLLLCVNIASSQGFEDPDPGAVQKISEISIPSAQSFEFTKRGNLPVDESSGRANVSIPLGEFKQGDIVVPIGLSYSGTGVRMSDVTGWTGANWSLNAGGVITRVVRDLPDEGDEIKLYNLLQNSSELTPSEVSQNIDMLRQNQLNDSMYDLFNFSFLNYSGEFILKEKITLLLQLF